MEILVCISICITTILVGRSYIQHKIDTEKARVGREAVALMYNFSTIGQLDNQMTALRELVTDDVFQQLTIDNEGRTLNTYLQFKCKSCEVEILESGTEFVIYKLNASSGTPTEDEIFLFIYNVDSSGKICWVKEYEGYEFTDSINYQGFDF